MNTKLLRGALGLMAGLLAASSGWGYTYILTNDTTGLPVKWPDGTVGITIMLQPANLTSTPPSFPLQDGSPSFNASAQAAAQTWNSLLGAFQFQVTLATSGSPGDHNHVNEVAFAANAFGQAFDSTTLAVTTTWLDNNTGARTEGDIIFNAARNWNSYSGSLQSAVDLHRVALHEMGHLLGLDHPDQASPPQSQPAIMDSQISNVDNLTMDDITGAQNLYGPLTAPAGNDNFANATAITLNSSNTASVSGFSNKATKETGEPTVTGTTGGHSVWWKWTAPSTGGVTLDTGKFDPTTTAIDFTNNRSSYFDTTLGVYTGSSVSALSTVASNDDIKDGVVQISSVTFNANAGTTYYFAVDGFGATDTGGINLNLAFTPSNGTLPTFTTQPISQTVTANTNVNFVAAASAGTSTVSYQWQFNGVAISGATSATLTLTNVMSANAGSYVAIASTNAGSVASNAAMLTVTAAPVVTPMPTPMPSSGGGGGGGAPSLWFCAALSALAAARWRQRRDLRPET